MTASHKGTLTHITSWPPAQNTSTRLLPTYLIGSRLRVPVYPDSDGMNALDFVAVKNILEGIVSIMHVITWQIGFWTPSIERK
jgi:hypothetical protein